MANNFEFYIGLRGWKPYIEQKIMLKREHNNLYNKFAVARKVTMKGKIGLIVAGHVPREFSRHFRFSIGEGAKFEAEVHKEKPMTSRSVQGGLEIPIKVSVMWDEPEKLSILVAEVKEVEYPMTGEYVNDLINILQELGIEEDEDDNDYEEFQTETVDIIITLKCYKKYFQFFLYLT